LKPFEVSEELESLGREVSSIAGSAASRLFDPTCEIEVRLESGSLKGRVAVIGMLLGGVYHGVAVYKDFKTGLTEIVADGREFGDRVIEAVIKQHEVPPKSIYRTERRTETPGKILRVLQRREWLATHRALLSDAEINREISDIEALTARVMQDDFTDDERSLVLDVFKEASVAAQEVSRPEYPRVRTRVPHGRSNDQPGLFDPTLYSIGSGHGLSVRVTIKQEPDEYYARFKLSDWQAQRPLGHFPRDPPERPSPSPNAVPPLRRDRGTL
jgi:hypothetical protein